MCFKFQPTFPSVVKSVRGSRSVHKSARIKGESALYLYKTKIERRKNAKSSGTFDALFSPNRYGDSAWHRTETAVSVMLAAKTCCRSWAFLGSMVNGFASREEAYVCATLESGPGKLLSRSSHRRHYSFWEITSYRYRHSRSNRSLQFPLLFQLLVLQLRVLKTFILRFAVVHPV